MTSDYLAKWDELNVLKKTMYAGIGTDTGKKNAVKQFEDMLIDAYLSGYIETGYDLSAEVMTADYARANTVTEQAYDGESITQKFENYFDSGDTDALDRLTESEQHRAFSQGAYDCAEDYSRQSGKNVYKVWLTMMDDRVRDVHQDLEGVRIPLDELFYIGDDGAYAPGGFSSPENNVNCRCVLRYEAE